MTSEHFTIWTDASAPRAHELSREVEHLRRVVAGVAFPGMMPNGRSLVIALRNDDELLVFSPTSEARAYVSTANELAEPIVVLSAYSNYRSSSVTTAHELTHLIAASVIHRQPRWLSEGMAQFFETVGLDPDAQIVRVGGTSQLREGVRPHLLPISKLFAWSGLSTGDKELGYYSTAWALFTYLFNEHRAELVHYLELLEAADGPANGAWEVQVERIWRDAFPSLAAANVDTELREWLVTGRHLVIDIRVQPRRSPATQRTLSDADVNALYAFAHGSSAEEPMARRELAAALVADPTHVLTHLLIIQRNGPKPTPEVARAITGAHPDEWRAWLISSTSLPDQVEREAARVKACALIAQNPALYQPRLCPADRSTASAP